MAKDDADKAVGTSLAQRGLGLLEQAWASQWALRLACAVLFLDMAMMLRVGRGLWQWSAGDMELLRDVGWLSLVVVAFSLSVAIVLPVVLFVLRPLAIYIWYGLVSLLPWLFRPDVRLYQRGIGYVPAQALRDAALREKDPFLFRLYEEYEQTKEAGREFLGSFQYLYCITLG
ncbi:MAG: hypothetical protein ACTIKU_06625 [Halomonas sp.]|uniref:hypothetical protein n=1 Tax=unclassified Halomonas TaxID=2609666 RepID=UPI003FB999EE